MIGRLVPRIPKSETESESTQHIDSQDQHQRIYTPYEGYCSLCGAYQIGGARGVYIFCSECGQTARLM